MANRSALTLSIFINRSPDAVYDFASQPVNLPQWAGGLCRAIRKSSDDQWLINTPDGDVVLRFAARNAYRVLDHSIILAPDVVVDVPMRVLPQDDGSLVILTLFRLAGMDDESFQADASMVEKDLIQLKLVVEALSASQSV